MLDLLNAEDKLTRQELLAVVGGKSISGTLVNAFTTAFKTIYGFGQDFGGALRRFKTRSLCSL